MINLEKSTTQHGFTFVELLVSMSILMLIGSVMLVIFVSTLRGTNKTQALISLRQDGNYALSQMSKFIRDGDAVSCSPLDTTRVVVRSPRDNRSTTIRCDLTTDTISSESANGTYYFLRNPQKASISACSLTCGTIGSDQKPFVTFSFTLTSPDSTLGTADFSTSVILRNASFE